MSKILSSISSNILSLVSSFFSLVNVCVWEPNGLSLGGNVGCVRNCPCREKFCWNDRKLSGGGDGGGSGGGG